MKVVLCFPPTLRQSAIPILKGSTPNPPLGLAYLASSLEQAGHKVKIIDSPHMHYNYKEIFREIKKFEPNVVGISSLTFSFYDSIKILKIVKKNLPNCITVLGGVHPTALAKEILTEYSFVDVIIKGEGELTFVELLEKKKNKQYSDVKGIVYRDEKRIIENKPRKRIENLDDLPFPAYHLLPMEKYTGRYNWFNIERKRDIKPIGRIITSRGCPYNCAFCSSKLMWGKQVFLRNPEKIVEEIKFLKEKYKMNFIEFSDETFTIDQKRTEKIRLLLKKEKIDVSFLCNTRTNLFNKEIANSLKKMRCNIVFFGFESGVQKTLDFLNKGIKITDSIKAVENARDAGLTIIGNFIIGVPGETKENINQTISFARKLDIDFPSFTILMPFPGTPIYDYAVRNNLLLTKNWSKYAGSSIVMKTPGISPFELKFYLLKAYFVTRQKSKALVSPNLIKTE